MGARKKANGHHWGGSQNIALGLMGPWFHMGPHGSPWIPMAPHGSQWLPKGPCVPMGPMGPPMGSHGFPPWGSHGSPPWDPMGSPPWAPGGIIDNWALGPPGPFDEICYARPGPF